MYTFEGIENSIVSEVDDRGGAVQVEYGGGKSVYFFLANRLLSNVKTFATLNWTYSRSRFSCPSFCISKRSSSFKSNSSSPRARPVPVSVDSNVFRSRRTFVVKADDEGAC